MPPRAQTRFLSTSSGSMSETSPLLRARYSNGYNVPPPSFGIPAILPAIASLPTPPTLTTNSLYHAVPFLQSLQRTEQVAWVLCTLLYMHAEAAVGGWNSTHGTWERWKTLEDAKEGRSNIEKLIEATWNEFVEVWREVENPARAGDAVEDVLWASIPLDEGGRKWIRAIDLAISPNAPSNFISHPLVLVSISKTWEGGFKKPPEDSSWWNFDKSTTPQIAHGVFMLYHGLFVFLLTNLVLEGPSLPIYIRLPNKAGIREVYLFVYALSSIRPAFASLAHALVAASVISAFPSAPLSNTTPHSILLLALSLILLQLHLPTPGWLPSPIYTFRPPRVTPLATLVQSIIRKAIVPAVTFFAPTVMVLFVLLSIALGDSFPLALFILNLFGLGPEGPKPFTGPSHPLTRLTLLLLFLTAISATSFLILILVLLYPSMPDSHAKAASAPISGWDQFGTRNALLAKRNFISVCLQYASPPSHPHLERDWISVPPPWNVFGFVFGSAFGWVVGRVGGGDVNMRRERGRRWSRAVWMGIWRLVVGTPGAAISGMWFWRT